MNLLKEVFAHEVYPAFGCTEPISCAYAAATAAAQLGEPVESLALKVDPGTYKNGAAVTVPHGGGAKGNLIAAALGAALARPDAKLELLQYVTDEVQRRARAMYDAGRCQIECLADRCGFHIEAVVRGAAHRASCVVSGGHTNVVLVERDGRTVLQNGSASSPGEVLAYRLALRQLSMADVLALAETLDADDREFLQRGVEMNLAASEWGFEVGGMAQQLHQMHRDGFLADDMFYRVKLRVASAVDVRMTGVARAIMTSGGAGNQGIVAILTPYLVGREMDVDLDRIIRSLAVAHLVNAYVKCFVGEISAICGCAMAAGIGSATAVVYQQRGADLERIGLAVGNVVGDLCGLICDGAKPGCAMKVVTAVDSALRSALMALRGYGLSTNDGLTGHSVEDSLKNLGRMTREGMGCVDPTMLHILQDKNAADGRA
jgi:L-cysteine desulfidase